MLNRRLATVEVSQTEKDNIMNTVAKLAQPRPMKSVESPSVLGNYETVAQSIGFMPPPLLEKLLAIFFNEQKIGLFCNDEVDMYLSEIAEAEKESWVWRPLRERDARYRSSIQGRESVEKNPRHPNNPGRYRHGCFDPKFTYYCGTHAPYDRLIPLHILRHVALIQAKFDNHVFFFVSDYAVVNPDPFIMVTAPDVKQFVFGVWDEPGFGLDTKDT